MERKLSNATAAWLEQAGPGRLGSSGLVWRIHFSDFFIFIGTLQNHARKYNLPIDELSFQYNMIPTYRDQAAVIEAAKTVQFGRELPMDIEVLSPWLLLQQSSFCPTVSQYLRQPPLSLLPPICRSRRGSMGHTSHKLPN